MGDRPEDFSLAHSTSHLLHRAQHLAAERFAKRIASLNLRQYILLAAVAEHAGASQSQLVRITSIDRSTLADMLRRLQDQGLVARAISDADARAKSVRLTSEGKTILADAADQARKADQAVLDALPKGKRKAFQDALTRLSKAIDDAAEKAERDAKKKKKRDKAKGKEL